MQRVRDVETKKGTVREYRRFGLFHKIEHWIFMASFSILGLTGLLQRYAASPVSQAIIEGLGGIENMRFIHRISGSVNHRR